MGKRKYERGSILWRARIHNIFFAVLLTVVSIAMLLVGIVAYRSQDTARQKHIQDVIDCKDSCITRNADFYYDSSFHCHCVRGQVFEPSTPEEEIE